MDHEADIVEESHYVKQLCDNKTLEKRIVNQNVLFNHGMEILNK